MAIDKARGRSRYEVMVRELGVSQALSIKACRGTLTVRGAEKVVPPTLVYGEDGNYQLLTLQDVLARWTPGKYKARTKDFNTDRLANTDVSQLLKLVENYPTLDQEYCPEETKPKPHPLAELLYATQIFQQPNEELSAKLATMDVLSASQYKAKCLALAAEKLAAEHGIRLDEHAVLKKDVGHIAYVAGDDGLGMAPKFFALGFHQAIPLDRIARELGQLKAAERFVQPAPVRHSIKPQIAPYVTGLRVAVVYTAVSMLDSGDLFPSSIPKLAARLFKRVEIRDLETVPKEQQKLKAKVFHAGVEIVHEEVETMDELQQGFPCLKLLMPGGVKIAAQLQPELQAQTLDGQAVDLLMDLRTFASKGAVALLAMMDPQAWELSEPTLEQCWDIVKNLPKQVVQIGDAQYEAYVGTLPVFRTRQRYTELSKGSNRVGCDLVSLATLGLPFEVRPQLEEDYQELRAFRTALSRTLSAEQNGSGKQNDVPVIVGLP